MNKLRFYLASLFILGCVWCIQSQNHDEQVLKMLNEFYVAHINAWNKTKDPNLLIRKLDSLQQIYCSESLKVGLKKQFKISGLDHDIFTNDYSTDFESLKSLLITKNPTKSNCFIVTYNVNTFDPTGKSIKKKVVVNLNVVLENGGYKIQNVW